MKPDILTEITKILFIDVQVFWRQLLKKLLYHDKTKKIAVKHEGTYHE